MADDQTPQPIDPAQGQTDDQITQASSLPEDNGTPFQPADDPTANLDDTHQATDNQTNIDKHEAYDEGASGAAEAQEPLNPGIGGYTPPSNGEHGQSTAANDNASSNGV